VTSGGGFGVSSGVGTAGRRAVQTAMRSGSSDFGLLRPDMGNGEKPLSYRSWWA
jgi:hypothetical protein